MRDPEKTKDIILSAAEQVIAEKGLPALTLDDVATRASVSKGGLLHHFPSKQALINGLAQRMIALHIKDIEAYQQQDPEPPGAYTRAFLRANLACEEDDSTKVCAAMTAETRAYPKMIELFREYSQQCEARMAKDGLDTTAASVVRYAAEGLMATAMWGMPRPANYDEVVQYLLKLAGQRS